MGVVEKKAEKKRKEIMQAVLDKLSDQNFEDITIKMICSAANISVGTFYHYFKEKSNLAMEMSCLLDDFITNSLVPLLKSKDEAQNFNNYCRGVCEYLMQDGPARARLINSLYPSYEQYHGDDIENEQDRPLFAELNRILERGVQKGQFSTQIDSAKTAYMVVTVLRGYSYDWVRHNGQYNLVEHIDQFTGLLIKSLRPNPLGLLGLSAQRG